MATAASHLAAKELFRNTAEATALRLGSRGFGDSRDQSLENFWCGGLECLAVLLVCCHVRTTRLLGAWVRGCQCCLSSSWTREGASGIGSIGKSIPVGHWSPSTHRKSLPTRCGFHLPDRRFSHRGKWASGQVGKWAITARLVVLRLPARQCSYHLSNGCSVHTVCFRCSVQLVRTTPPCLPREDCRPPPNPNPEMACGAGAMRLWQRVMPATGSWRKGATRSPLRISFVRDSPSRAGYLGYLWSLSPANSVASFATTSASRTLKMSSANGNTAGTPPTALRHNAWIGSAGPGGLDLRSQCRPTPPPPLRD